MVLDRHKNKSKIVSDYKYNRLTVGGLSDAIQTGGIIITSQRV